MSDEREVLHVWHGLGYYSRARNIHKSANIIHLHHNDIFPTDYETVRRLPGVGDYTASAIMSFAYNQPFFAIDGNAIRVLSRLFDIAENYNLPEGKKQFTEVANEIFDYTRPRLFNSAFMELGEVVCVPLRPDCNRCPVVAHCLSYNHHTSHLRPAKKIKKASRKRFFAYRVYIDKEGQTLLYQRLENDIWKHLYEFPMTEVDFLTPTPKSVKTRHILTHQTIEACFNVIEVETLPNLPNTIRVKFHDILNFPISRMITKILPDLIALLDNQTSARFC